MHSALTLSLLRWSAWTPGATRVDEWRALLCAGAQADADTSTKANVDFVAPMLRRRLSSLSRSALAVAHDCLQGVEGADSCRTLFASPHGEVGRTVELLQQLAADEPLSPNAFSLSVHNTASGLHAIVTGNRAASTALAAGRDTLALAFIDAAGRLARDPQPLLLVYADEPLPPFYQRWQPQPARALALALLLAPAQAGGRNLQLQRSADRAAAADPLALLPLLLGTAADATVGGERSGWRWQIDGSAAA